MKKFRKFFSSGLGQKAAQAFKDTQYAIRGAINNPQQAYALAQDAVKGGKNLFDKAMRGEAKIGDIRHYGSDILGRYADITKAGGGSGQAADKVAGVIDQGLSRAQGISSAAQRGMKAIQGGASDIKTLYRMGKSAVEGAKRGEGINIDVQKARNHFTNVKNATQRAKASARDLRQYGLGDPRTYTSYMRSGMGTENSEPAVSRAMRNASQRYRGQPRSSHNLRGKLSRRSRTPRTTGDFYH